MNLLIVLLLLIIGVSARYFFKWLVDRRKRKTSYLYYKDVAITALRDSELIKLACDGDLNARTHEEVYKELKNRNIHLDHVPGPPTS